MRSGEFGQRRFAGLLHCAQVAGLVLLFTGSVLAQTGGIDVRVIDGSVDGMGRTVRVLAGTLRKMQAGYVRVYAGWILFGGVLVVAWMLR